jgi:hypothetical protein
MKLHKAIEIAENWRIQMHESVRYDYRPTYDQDMDDAIKRLVKLAKYELKAKRRSAK